MLRTLRPTSQACHENRWLEWLEWLDSAGCKLWVSCVSSFVAEGATDTTSLGCRYGNPQMWNHCGTCCGLRPHFNWVVATCEACWRFQSFLCLEISTTAECHVEASLCFLIVPIVEFWWGDRRHRPVLLEYAKVCNRGIAQNQLRCRLPVWWREANLQKVMRISSGLQINFASPNSWSYWIRILYADGQFTEELYPDGWIYCWRVEWRRWELPVVDLLRP